MDTTTAQTPDALTPFKQVPTALLVRLSPPEAIGPESDEKWREIASRIEPRAQLLLDEAQTVPVENIMLRTELAGAARMLMLSKVSWDMADTAPGDCAGITFQQGSDEELIDARKTIRDALRFSEQILKKANEFAQSRD